MLKGFQLFSPFHWIRLLQPWVSALATQQRIAAYIVTEVIVDLGLLFFYLFFRDVALTRRSWWVFYFTAAFLRIVGSCVGFVGILWRSMKWTRVYYFIFCISTLGVLWSALPIHRLRCACDNYTSCQSLSAFAPPGRPFLHGENPPTNYMSLISNSYIRVEASPKKDKHTPEVTMSNANAVLHDKAELEGGFALAEAEGDVEPSSDWATHYSTDEATSSLIAMGSSASASASASAGARLAAQVELETLSQADEALAREEAAVLAKKSAEREALLVGRSSGNSSSSSSKGHFTTPREEESAKKVLNWWRTRHIRRGQEVFDRGYLANFWITPNSAQFDPRTRRSNDHESGGDYCMPSPLQGTQVGIFALQSKLEDLRQSVWDRRLAKLDLISNTIIDSLSKCFSNPECSSIQLSTHLRGPRLNPILVVCYQMGLQRVRDRREELLDHDYMNTPFSLTLRRRNLLAISVVKQPLYSLKLRTESSTDGLTRLYEAAERACVCSLEDGRNCRRDSDTGPQTKYWCFVDPDDVRACLGNNFRVYKDVAGKFFTYDLCTAPTSRQQCQCSGLGSYPPSSEKSFSHMLWDNKLNYGAQCNDWNDNGHSWCYVGFDSTCADRKGRQHYAREDTLNLFADVVSKPLQYKSQLPCLGSEQDEIAELATQRCWVFKILTFTIVVLHVCFARIVGGCLLHTFIANRCTDPVTVESQFDVSFSDDEEIVTGGTGPAEDSESEAK